jgi:zinc protease
VAKAGFITNLESLAARADMVADLVQFEREFDFNSSQEYLIKELQKIESLDGGKFRQFIKGTLRKDNAVVVVIKADKKGLKGDRRSGLKFTARSHDKEMTPILDPREASRPLAAPRTMSILRTAERYTLGNGMEVVLLPKTEGMPVVTAELLFDVGSAHEPPHLAGLAEVAASYLRPSRDANFMRIGIQLGSSVDDDHTTFYARGVEIYLEPIIKGLERLIKAGEYDQETLERWQKYQRLRMDTQSYRQAVAFDTTMASALYGADHPYATTGTPTRDAVARIGYDEVTRFQRKHYSARNATLVMVGRFDPQRARAIIARTFGDWDGGHEDKPAPRRGLSTGPQYFGVIGRETPQMQVVIAYPAPAGMDGQHAARMVLAHMLNLRMARIRAELGSTYGAYARHSAGVGAGAYVMGGSVDATRAGESLAAMRSAIESLRRGETFDLDFVRARRVVLRQLLAESTETLALAGRLASIAAYDLPADHHDTLIRYVAAVSPAQVKALLATELDPQFEIVGGMADRASLTRAFAEAGLSPVRYVEDD